MQADADGEQVEQPEGTPAWYAEAEQPPVPMTPRPDRERTLLFGERMLAALPAHLHLTWYEAAHQPIGRHHPSLWEGADYEDEVQYIITRPGDAAHYILLVEHHHQLAMTTAWTNLDDAMVAAQWDWAYGRYQDVLDELESIRSIWQNAIERNKIFAPDWEAIIQERRTTLGAYVPEDWDGGIDPEGPFPELPPAQREGLRPYSSYTEAPDQPPRGHHHHCHVCDVAMDHGLVRMHNKYCPQCVSAGFPQAPASAIALKPCQCSDPAVNFDHRADNLDHS